MMHMGRWCLVAAVLLLPGRGTAATTLSEAFFQLLDRATVVAEGSIERTDTFKDGQLVVYRLGVGARLKGELPAATTIVSAVQELVFSTDRATLANGMRGIALLEPLPTYSSYRNALPEGSYYRFVGERPLLFDPAVADLIRRWVALAALPQVEQPRARIALSIDLLPEATAGDAAAAQLGRSSDLAPLLDEAALTRLTATLGNAALPLARRRAILAALSSRHVTAALPHLRPLEADSSLGPYVRETIASLGGSVTTEALFRDIERGDPDQRAAALRALAARDAERSAEVVERVGKVATADSDERVRLTAIETLGHCGDAAVPVLGTLLGDPSKRLAHGASRALVNVHSSAAVAVLAQQFTSGSNEAQVLAVFALRDINTSEASAALARAKEHASDPRLVRVIDLATGAGGREH